MKVDGRNKNYDWYELSNLIYQFISCINLQHCCSFFLCPVQLLNPALFVSCDAACKVAVVLIRRREELARNPFL